MHLSNIPSLLGAAFISLVIALPASAATIPADCFARGSLQSTAIGGLLDTFTGIEDTGDCLNQGDFNHLLTVEVAPEDVSTTIQIGWFEWDGGNNRITGALLGPLFEVVLESPLSGFMFGDGFLPSDPTKALVVSVLDDGVSLDSTFQYAVEPFAFITPFDGPVTILATSSPAPVPLPAAGWLLVAALGGLGALRRRP